MTSVVDFCALQPKQVRPERTERDGNRFYTYPPTGEQWISVTSVTGGTSDKPWLPAWASKVAATYAVMNMKDLLDLMRREGDEAAIKQIKEQAAIIRDRKADTGTYIHDVAEALILWAASPEGHGSEVALPSIPDHLAGHLYDEDPVEDVIDWMTTGFLNFVSDFSPRFLAAEMTVFHPGLKVAGTLDTILVLYGYDLSPTGRLISRPGHQLVICVDFKTGRILDRMIKEQCSSYPRMTECLLPMGEIVPMPPVDISAVLHLRPEFSRGYRFEPISRGDDARAWNRFRKALGIYQERLEVRDKPGIPAYPLRLDGTMPPRRCEDMDGEGYGRAPGALAKAGIEDLEMLAALTAAECLDLKGIGEKSLDPIRRMLADEGLYLSGEAPLGEAA